MARVHSQTGAPRSDDSVSDLALTASLSRSGRGSSAGEFDTPVVDVELLTDYLGFVIRSLRRHWRGALLTFALTLTAVGLALSAWPRTYQIDGRLLVQSSSLVSSLVNPERGVSREGLGPTLAAQEIVKSRDRLLAIMQATDLIAEWDRTRTPLFKLKDWAVSLIGGVPTEEGRLDAMAGLLEDRLQVSTTDEGTVMFVLKWPDPAMGRKLVDSAMQSFLEHRRVTEAAAITDSIAILDRSANTIEAGIKATLELLPAPPSGPRRRAVVRPTSSGPSAEVTVRLARLRSALAERQQEVARLEGVYTQQLGEAQARLSAALTIYTEGHPTVVALKQTVARLAAEPPDLAAARRDARGLEAQYDDLSTSVGALTASAEQERLMSQLDAATPAASVDFFRPSNGEADPVGLRLKNQMTELAMVQARASAARAEFASAEAGFKYQYSVVRPPQLPRAPVAPNVPAILVAGLVASVLLALLFALGSDLAGGRALEAWQVERLVRASVALRVPTL
jgi:hypothetical protein